MDEIDRLLQNNAFTPTLALETRYQLRQAIEPLPDGRTSLLLRGDMVVLLFLVGQTGLVLILSGQLLRGAGGCRGRPVIAVFWIHVGFGRCEGTG